MIDLLRSSLAIPVFPELTPTETLEKYMAMEEGREPREHLFERIPKSMDVQSYRRGSAQARYQHLAPSRELPSSDAKWIKPTECDKSAAQEVSESLGHSRRRRSTILNHYLLK